MNLSHCGLLLVDKPAGPTSHDVVQAARRAIRERRIGHTGTLDPAATGLLVLCVGKATRLQQHLLAWPKVYVGEIQLGQATTTYDTEGEPLGEVMTAPPLTQDVLDGLQLRFSGDLDQVPPPYSAKKSGGRKFYELARAGEEVPLTPKRVSIQEMELQAAGSTRLRFRVACSSGTYVRSLAHDIGIALGCGGHLGLLRRESIGPYQVSAAVQAEVLANRPHDIPATALIPVRDVALPYPGVVLNPTAVDHFAHGQEIMVREVDGDFVPGKPVLVRDRTGRVIGVGAVIAYLPRARTLNLAPRMVLGELESPEGS
jgi:tRNA pseudouridine55 synthase